MIRINYEAWVEEPTLKRLVYVRASGMTPKEVEADAWRQADAMGVRKMRAVGLHNNKADWNAMYGEDYPPDSKFADSPSPPEPHPNKEPVSVLPELIIVLIMAVLLWLASIDGKPRRDYGGHEIQAGSVSIYEEAADHGKGRSI